MSKYFCLPLLVLCSCVLLAQQPAARRGTQAAQPKPSVDKPNVNSPSADPPTREQVLKLLVLLKVRDTIKITVDATKQQVEGSAEEIFRDKVPNPTPEQLGSLRAIVGDVFSEISPEEIIQDVVPV